MNETKERVVRIVCGTKKSHKISLTRAVRNQVAAGGDAVETVIAYNIDIVTKLADHFSQFGYLSDEIISEGNLKLVEFANAKEADGFRHFRSEAERYVKKGIEKYLARIRPEPASHMADVIAGSKWVGMPTMEITFRDLGDDAFIGDPENDLAEKDETAMIISVLKETMKTLAERERKVVELRYLSDRKYTFVELAKLLKVTTERVRQIERKAFRKIKSRMLYVIREASIDATMAQYSL